MKSKKPGSELLRKRIDLFLERNPNAKLGRSWGIEHFITFVGDTLKGQCPCDPERVRCPCAKAPREIEKSGRCFCGLFIRKKTINK